MRSTMSSLTFSGVAYCRDAVNHSGDFAPREPVDVSAVTWGCPIHCGLNSGRYVTISEHAKRAYPIHNPTEYFEARGVYPMRVLKNHKDRIGTRQRF